VEELMDIITEDRLTIYRDVLQGLYEIKKGTVWKEDIFKKTMTVKNVEVFEKVVPLFVSMSKQYNVEDIKDIFEYCRNKNKTFNFAAIKRIKLLINILYNNKQERLDLPIQDFMNRVYELCQYEKIKASEVRKFIHEYAQQYAVKESQGDIKIYMAQITMEKIQDTFDKIFKCLVKMSRPNKQGICTLEKVELLWKERGEYDKITPGEHAFLLADFLGNHNVDIESIHTDKYSSKEIEI
jgi:hypothetical protein